MATATVAELIEPHILYSRTEFKRRSGLGDFAIRKAKKDGLKVTPRGGREWILGRDFIEFVGKQTPAAS